MVVVIDVVVAVVTAHKREFTKLKIGLGTGGCMTVLQNVLRKQSPHPPTHRPITQGSLIILIVIVMVGLVSGIGATEKHDAENTSRDKGSYDSCTRLSRETVIYPPNQRPVSRTNPISTNQPLPYTL